MPTIIDGDGRSYEQESTLIEVGGDQFATGLWIPHEPDFIERDIMLSASAEAVRDMQDVREIVSNPNRTPASKRFPNRLYIRSQGNVGSCAGYAGAWTLARARVMAGMDFTPLSGESLYAQTNRGRDAGSGLINNIRAMVATGVAPEGLNTPGKFYTEQSLPAAAKAERHRFRVLEWHQVQSELGLAIALASGFIVAVACHVGGAWRRMDGDVLVGNSGPGNHATLCDDVRFTASGKPQFRMANSHGLNWGVEGVAWTEWDKHFAAPNRNHVFYAIRAVSPDPKGSNPPELK
jgi:hypothetical protein